jgi:membrane-bound metal-dependent hydrolase YbcI (DUF457 family)
MRRQTHFIIGAMAFSAYSYPLYLLLEIPASTMLMGFFAALLGSVMPDVIEPARTWSHRGSGHSRRAMRFAASVFVFTAMLGLFQYFDPSLALSYIVSCFFLGYALHLLTDATTPAGLPGG